MRYGLLGLLLIVGAYAAAPSGASAHAAFIVSNPAPDSTVDALPEQVRIVFSEQVASWATTVTVYGPDGSVASGDLTVSERAVTTPLTWAGAGAYLVQWTNTSLEDGHESSGEFTFTLAG